MLGAGDADVGRADEPGGAGDEQLHYLPFSSASALGEVAGQPVLPGGQPDRVLALAGQGRVGRPRCRPAEFLGADREHFAVDLGLLEDLAARTHTRSTAGRGHVVDAELEALDQAHDPVGEVPGVGRRADLVADDEDLAAAGGQAQHRLHEVVAADPEEAGRADHEVALVGGRGRLLAGQLGAAVGGERRRLVALDVGLALGPVEDVVGGDVDDAGADRGGRGGDVAGAGPVDREGRLLGLLGPVDVGPGGAVDDDVGPLEVDPAATASASATSSSARPKPTTSWPALPAASIRSRPSIPAAPVTRTFIGRARANHGCGQATSTRTPGEAQPRPPAPSGGANARPGRTPPMKGA